MLAHLESKTFQCEISDEIEPATNVITDYLYSRYSEEATIKFSRSHLSSRSLSVSTSPILVSKGSQFEKVVILCKLNLEEVIFQI